MKNKRQFTFSKHIKWRVDNKGLLICDCKRLIDFIIPLNFKTFLKKVDQGIFEKDIKSKEEKILFKDFKKASLLGELKIKNLNKDSFKKAMLILDKELGTQRVRTPKFLMGKFKEFPFFFKGIFLKDDLVGVLCGFPRENYLLISEIAIDERFQKRGFGRKLIDDFEKEAKKRNYSQINVGAYDTSISFYSLMRYKPFLLVQMKKKYKSKKINGVQIIKDFILGNQRILELNVEKSSLGEISILRKKYPFASFQYIFTKKI